MNTMDNILVKYSSQKKEKGDSLPEFLAVPVDQLSEMEQKVQKALAFIYKENDRKQPLFEKFCDWIPGKPLTIDCLDLSEDENEAKFYTAAYSSVKNNITFGMTEAIDMIEILVHELNHAAKNTKEMYDLNEKYLKEDKKAYKQLDLMNEADSFLLGYYVDMQQYKGKTFAEILIDESDLPFEQLDLDKYSLFFGAKYNGKTDKLEYVLPPDILEDKVENVDWPSFRKILLSSQYNILSADHFYCARHDLTKETKSTDSQNNLPNVLKALSIPEFEGDIYAPDKVLDFDLFFKGQCDYARFLLSRGKTKRVAEFMQKRFLNDLNFADIFQERKEKNIPFTSEEMDMFETKDENGTYLLFPDRRKDYIDLLKSQKETDRVVKLLREGFCDTTHRDMKKMQDENVVNALIQNIFCR